MAEHPFLNGLLKKWPDMLRNFGPLAGYAPESYAFLVLKQSIFAYFLYKIDRTEMANPYGIILSPGRICSGICWLSLMLYHGCRYNLSSF